MIEELQRRVDRLDGIYQGLKGQEKSLDAAILNLKSDIEILTKTSAVLKHLLDSMVKDEVNKIAGLITYGLKTVFDDQNLVFVPEISKKNEKISIELRTNRDGIEGSFDSFGGSVAVIESFLLRILYILKKKKPRLLLLDETFAPVGKEYIANTYRLVNELSKKLGIDILLVTQHRDFYEGADKVYQAQESKDGLTMNRIKE